MHQSEHDHIISQVVSSCIFELVEHSEFQSQKRDRRLHGQWHGQKTSYTSTQNHPKPWTSHGHSCSLRWSFNVLNRPKRSERHTIWRRTTGDQLRSFVWTSGRKKSWNKGPRAAGSWNKLGVVLWISWNLCRSSESCSTWRMLCHLMLCYVLSPVQIDVCYVFFRLRIPPTPKSWFDQSSWSFASGPRAPVTIFADGQFGWLYPRPSMEPSICARDHPTRDEEFFTPVAVECLRMWFLCVKLQYIVVTY